jgi:hypothetical protein
MMRLTRGKLESMRPARTVLGFDLLREQQVDWVVPTIAGSRLIDLVREYERSMGYEPAGSYAGLILSFLNFGQLDQHYEGRGFDAPQAVVLGCGCGESGCWPLLVSVTTEPGYVTWSEFSQPHRPNWDYAGMGTYRFERWQFDQAVQDLIRRVTNATGGGRA